MTRSRLDALRNTLVLMAILFTAVPNAQAKLERVGPINTAPPVGNYPAWYQDTTGLALEFCDPKNQAEVDGGWCLLLPGDVAVPEAFPLNFFDEHFYYAAQASIDPLPANLRSALLVLAVEAAFAGPVEQGGQITFSRIRMRLDPVPMDGTYRFIHPYGEESIDAAAGDRIFFTDDVGFACAQGTFDCALNSRLGPFLLPSDSPGGSELPAIQGPVPGKFYIADPARIGPVTGSPLGANLFRIEGPIGSSLGGPGVDFVETTNFSLMGRIFTASIPGHVEVDRASYTQDGTVRKVDVMAAGFPTTQSRMPGNSTPAKAMPDLSVYTAPCVGTAAPYSPPAGTATKMLASGSNFWKQFTYAGDVPPDGVCVVDAAPRDANGNSVPVYYPARVTDEVTIAGASYDPGAKTLTVDASSSDTVAPPVLTLGGFGDLAADQITVTQLTAPPAKIRVLSSKGGMAELLVKTSPAVAPPPPTGPVAVDDPNVSVAEDSAAVSIAVLANDTGAAGGTVALRSQPRLGTAVVNADGTVSYTPRANVNGTDAFTYNVTVGTAVSNDATVTIVVTPVNDPPTAVDDSFSAAAGSSTNLNLIGNDTDPDGNADITEAVITVQPVGATVTGGAGGVVTFSGATTGGTYTFKYRAKDGALVLSNEATVTVNVIASDTVRVNKAVYTIKDRRWQWNGANTVDGATIKLSYVNGPFPGAVITTTTSVAGAWSFDSGKNATGILDLTAVQRQNIQVLVTSELNGRVLGSVTASILWK